MGAKMPSTNDFKKEIFEQIKRATKQNRPHVEINAGELHRVLGDYPNPKKHRMPELCEAMRQAMTAADKIIFSPEKGNGAALTIRYKLPRQTKKLPRPVKHPLA